MTHRVKHLLFVFAAYALLFIIGTACMLAAVIILDTLGSLVGLWP